MTIFYVLAALVLLGILVTVHEWGHFIAARMTGIPVREYSIGFGPLLKTWQSKKHETVFSVRLIPAGGFCAFYGEDDPDDAADDDPRAMSHFSVWKRLLVVFMGPMMNFVLAFLVGFGFYFCSGVTAVEYGKMRIESVNAGSVADLAGFEAGDYIVSVNGTDAAGLNDEGTGYRAIQLINAYQAGDEPLTVIVDRGGEEVTLSVTPVADSSGTMMIGVMISPEIIRQEQVQTGVLQSARLSFQLCVLEGRAILDALRELVSTGRNLSQMSGPVGVISVVADQTRSYGFTAYLELLIMISVNLGLVNLLPIPGLDGSQIVILLIEAIRRKPMHRKLEAYIKMAGFAALMLLFVVLTFHDVLNLIGGVG
ncbi:MAG: site-2 protease family protein [Clostridia bacterium]|nr:site-2 protease family protein [Clostridia bacterium]